MSNDLPEINFQGKKEEKKKGFIPWLRSRLGLGSRGSIGTAGSGAGGASSVPNIMLNAGRSGGMAGKAGLAAMLAGKGSFIVTAAVLAVGVGTYMAGRAPTPEQRADSFGSPRPAADYVPAIMRQQQQGSSLDMFKDTNKGAVSFDEPEAKKEQPAPAPAENPAEALPPEALPGGAGGEQGGEMVGKLMGSMGAGLSTTLGGGSNNMSRMGGFNNKFGQMGPKVGAGPVGSGFQAMPRFDQRKKVLAMNTGKKPVYTSANTPKRGKFGQGAFAQAKGVRSMQRGVGRTGNIDTLRHTQDSAWSGTTGEGEATGGAGVSEGSQGLVTSPSLDNAGAGAGGGGDVDPGNVLVPEDIPHIDVSPWAGLIKTIMMLVLLSAIITGLTAAAAKAGWIGKIIAMILFAVAAALAVAAIVMSIKLMSSFGQNKLGALYMLGGAMALAGAALALTGYDKFAGGKFTLPLWLALGAGLISSMGSMMGTPLVNAGGQSSLVNQEPGAESSTRR